MSKKLIGFLIIILNTVFVYSIIDVPSNVVVAGCGDNICSGNESCSNCKIDCGECFIPGGSGGGSSGGGGSGGGRPFVPDKPGEKPIESISKCSEYWICGDWNECVNNEQNRNCYDFEKCNTTLYKPEEKIECEQEVFPKPPEAKEYNLSLIPILILIILILIYLLVNNKKNRRKKRK
ncbi:MAG: hypothetical protein AABX29_08395 [Nanoarchaeota archaeon]